MIYNDISDIEDTLSTRVCYSVAADGTSTNLGWFIDFKTGAGIVSIIMTTGHGVVMIFVDTYNMYVNGVSSTFSDSYVDYELVVPRSNSTLTISTVCARYKTAETDTSAPEYRIKFGFSNNPGITLVTRVFFFNVVESASIEFYS